MHTAQRFFLILAVALFAAPAASSTFSCRASVDTLHEACKEQVYDADPLCRGAQKAYCIWKYTLCVRRCGKADEALTGMRLSEKIAGLEKRIETAAEKTLNKRIQCKQDTDCKTAHYKQGCKNAHYSALHPGLAARIETDIDMLRNYIAMRPDPTAICKATPVPASCNDLGKCVFGD